MKKMFTSVLIALALISCEKPQQNEDTGKGDIPADNTSQTDGSHGSFTDNQSTPLIPTGPIDMTPVREVLGVTHASSQYSLTDEPILIEGAKKLLELGTKCIKLWFVKPLSSYVSAARLCVMLLILSAGL